MAADNSTPRIALGQFNPTVGDFTQNKEKIIDLARRAEANRAELLALPYGALTGHPLFDLPLFADFAGKTRQTIKDLAHELGSLGLGGLPVILGHSAPTVNRANTADVAESLYLIHDGSATEILPTDGIGTVKCAGWNIGVLPQTTMTERFITGNGLDLALVVGAVPFERNGPQRTAAALTQAAQVAGAPLAFVNLVGGQDDFVFAGGSSLFDANGKLTARAPLFVEDLSLIDVGQMAQIAPEEPQEAQVYRALTRALADYVAKNGFRTVVFGLAGGIDSALVAVLAADALGGSQTLGIGMPSPYSSQHSRQDAADLARRIGANYQEVPIKPAMSAFTDMMEMPGVAEENLQARIRGVLLMAASNVSGNLVLAPGNKSELAVGYSTIYGDAVGGFGPIKDLYKTEVWALARWRNSEAADRGEVPPIPESSITKPPSAELRPDQVDQDSLPEYAVLDPRLRAHLEEHADRTELIAAGFPAETVDWVLRQVRISEWKRHQYAVGPTVTARSFDRNRRVPITNRWRNS